MTDRFDVPLSVFDDKIVVQVFKTNLLKLGRDKIAQNIVDRLPGVYCFYNDKTMYIGESSHPFTRLEQHLSTSNLKTSDEIMIFRSEQFHKSAIYDIETKLIDYVAAEQKFELRNEKTNQGDHEYFLKESYAPVIKEIWDRLREVGVVTSTMKQIENSEVFKFSPFKSLNAEQGRAVEEIISTKNLSKVTLIKGFPGTGKSIVASTLYKELSQKYNVCLTSGTHPTVNAFKNVFKLHQKSLKNNSKILETSKLLRTRDDFKIIIVDEAHRLMKKSGKGHGMKFAHIDNGKDELQMLIEKFEHVILLYDNNQIVHDGDIDFDETGNKYGVKVTTSFVLDQQMRSQDGYEYINLMVNLLDGKNVDFNNTTYEVKVFDKFSEMYGLLKSKSDEYPLTRLLSGYTRNWVSKEHFKNMANAPFDFDIDGIKLHWNSDRKGNWIYSEPAKRLEEVAYYHTVQGFDLHFAGVIIGKDLFLDNEGEIQVDEKYVVASNQKPPKNDPHYHEKLKKWVLNRYKILLSRASKGTYIYVEDEKLREYIKSKIKQA